MQGSYFARTPIAGGRSRGAPGVFFATRTRALEGAAAGYRYWRYIEAGGAVLDADLEMLRRSTPRAVSPQASRSLTSKARGQWPRRPSSRSTTAAPIRRAAQDAIGPAQRYALELLRDPTVTLPEGAERAADALAVERSSAVRRALNEIAAEAREERISRNDAARRVVELVDRLGLQPVAVGDVPPVITEDDLGVVCWMAVLPPG